VIELFRELQFIELIDNLPEKGTKVMYRILSERANSRKNLLPGGGGRGLIIFFYTSLRPLASISMEEIEDDVLSDRPTFLGLSSGIAIL
jgi:hypothetical protein